MKLTVAERLILLILFKRNNPQSLSDIVNVLSKTRRYSSKKAANDSLRKMMRSLEDKGLVEKIKCDLLGRKISFWTLSNRDRVEGSISEPRATETSPMEVDSGFFYLHAPLQDS